MTGVAFLYFLYIYQLSMMGRVPSQRSEILLKIIFPSVPQSFTLYTFSIKLSFRFFTCTSMFISALFKIDRT